MKLCWNIYIAYKMETQSNEVYGTSNLLIKYNSLHELTGYTTNE